MRTTPAQRTLATLLVSLIVVSLTSCSSKDPSSEPTNTMQAKDAIPVASKVIFRDSKGRELTEADLASVKGQFEWKIVGGDIVPEKAQELHRQGREAGGTGDHDRALVLLEQASKAAPKWPYPVYDAAFTHLAAGLAGLESGDYVGSHWLASFAVLALDG